MEDKVHEKHAIEHSRKEKLSDWVHVMKYVELALAIFTKKEQEKSYNRCKKKHIIKVQLIENEDNKKIIHCQVELEGRNADLTIFKSDRQNGNCFENSS